MLRGRKRWSTLRIIFARRGDCMAARKQFQSSLVVSPELNRLIEEARSQEVSEEELREQRVSFAFGNAPQSDFITKASVKRSSTNIRLT